MKTTSKDEVIVLLGILILSVIGSLIFLAAGTWVVAAVWRAVQ